MITFVIRHAGQEAPLAVPDYVFGSLMDAIRKAVVQHYIDTPVRGTRQEWYEAIRREGGSETVVDAGTVQNAYDQLGSQSRIDLFMHYADADMDRWSDLPDEVKEILRSRKR